MEKPALHDILCGVLDGPFPDGETHCYFEPPASMIIKYPCIVYNYVNDQDDYADNVHYRNFKRYSVSVIDEDPDSKIPDRLKQINYCSSDRKYAVDGLNHFVYTLFYNGPRIKEVNDNGKD